FFNFKPSKAAEPTSSPFLDADSAREKRKRQSTGSAAATEKKKQQARSSMDKILKRNFDPVVK
ncbi:hypothetical protein V5O48_019027, partial [Marasmius crinis-equi]